MPVSELLGARRVHQGSFTCDGERWQAARVKSYRRGAIHDVTLSRVVGGGIGGRHETKVIGPGHLVEVAS